MGSVIQRNLSERAAQLWLEAEPSNTAIVDLKLNALR